MPVGVALKYVMVGTGIRQCLRNVRMNMASFSTSLNIVNCFKVRIQSKVLDDNSFWEFVIFHCKAQTNRTSKEKETVLLKPHEEDLETIFFSWKASDAVVQTVGLNKELNDF
jgi:hypothetical protein